jgi:hypothetical protein
MARLQPTTPTPSTATTQNRDGIDLREDDAGEEEEHADDDDGNDDGDDTDDEDNDEAFEPCGGNGIINVKSLMRIASSIDLHEGSQHSPTDGSVSVPARRSSMDRRPPSTFQQPWRGDRIFEEVDSVSSGGGGGGGGGGSGGSEGGEELSAAGMAFGDDPGAAATMLVARLIAGSGAGACTRPLVSST